MWENLRFLQVLWEVWESPKTFPCFKGGISTKLVLRVIVENVLGILSAMSPSRAILTTCNAKSVRSHQSWPSAADLVLNDELSKFRCRCEGNLIDVRKVSPLHFNTDLPAPGQLDDRAVHPFLRGGRHLCCPPKPSERVVSEIVLMGFRHLLASGWISSFAITSPMGGQFSFFEEDLHAELTFKFSVFKETFVLLPGPLAAEEDNRSLPAGKIVEQGVLINPSAILRSFMASRLLKASLWSMDSIPFIGNSVSPAGWHVPAGAEAFEKKPPSGVDYPSHFSGSIQHSCRNKP